MQLAEDRIIELSQILQLENDFTRSTQKPTNDRFTVFVVFDKLPRFKPSNVSASKRGTTVGIVKLRAALIEYRPDFQAVSDFPAPSQKRRVFATSARPLPIVFNVFDEQVVRTFVGDFKSDCVPQLGHYRFISGLLFNSFFGDWLAHYCIEKHERESSNASPFGLLVPGLFADLSIQSVLAAIAKNFDCYLCAGQLARNDAVELHRRCYSLAIDGCYQVVFSQTGARRGSCTLGSNHKHSARVDGKFH